MVTKYPATFFSIYDTRLEIVKQYCYLGIIFSSSDSFNNACSVLYDKALKAFYLLKQIEPQHSVTLSLKLFDTLVLPILSYGGVVWGPLYAHKTNLQNFMNICNYSPIEKLNVKMCKYLLGVHRKSTNDAVRGELGRFPLLITILNNSFRYFEKMKTRCNNSLAKISCMDDDLLSLNSSWFNCMERLVHCFNQSRSLLSDMKNVYKIAWTNMITTCDGKLRTYSQFKKEFSIENYIIQLPLHLRRNFTKFRISAHNLAIETGRYNNTKSSNTSSNDKRLCFHCKTTESEFHFIFDCKLYENERQNLFECLNEFTTLSFNASIDSFCTLMSCLNGDLEVASCLCLFINNSFQIRSDVYNSAKEISILHRSETTNTRSGRISKRPAIFDL